MLIRFVAVAMAVPGLWFILSRWPDYPIAPRLLSETADVAGPWFAVYAGTMMLLPILKVGVSVALWRMCRWAWITSIVVLSLEFLLSAVSVVRLHFATSGAPSGIEESDPGVIYVAVHSMWPTYIVMVLSFLCLLVLLRETVRKQFDANSEIAQQQ